MRTLIIPDIHLDVAWAKRKLAEHKPDRVILLGDYFDPSPKARGNGQWLAKRGQSPAVVRWLAKLIEEYGDNAVLLIGNHDVAYLLPEFGGLYGTSNFSEEALAEIEALRAEVSLIRSKVRWFHAEPEPRFLFSHAGVSKAVFAKANGDVTTTNIERQVNTALLNAAQGLSHPALGLGEARGGRKGQKGGLTWLDFDDEFEPVPGWRQVVGHTVHFAGMAKRGENYAIDGMQTTVAILEDDEIRVVKGEK